MVLIGHNFLVKIMAYYFVASGVPLAFTEGDTSVSRSHTGGGHAELTRA
jgi:hypothetical protein